MGLILLPFAWGCAEALFFFIVPDVWMTVLARRSLRPGLVAALAGLAGALVGGSVLYMAGSADPELVRRIMTTIPGIDTDLVNRVNLLLRQQGVSALLFGPLKGIPYKLYAFQARAAGIGYPIFLAVSIVARLSRFLVVTIASHYALRGVALVWPGVNRRVVLLVCWLAFYLVYFSRMPG